MVEKKIDERSFDFALLVVDVYRFLLGKKETLYWIRLLKNSGYLNEYSKLELLDSEICSIVKIITSIVKTTQNSKPKTKN